MVKGGGYQWNLRISGACALVQLAQELNLHITLALAAASAEAGVQAGQWVTLHVANNKQGKHVYTCSACQAL